MKCPIEIELFKWIWNCTALKNVENLVENTTWDVRFFEKETGIIPSRRAKRSA